MRKLFRFKYEPCNKTCYAWCQKLMVELRALSSRHRQEIVEIMVAAHARLCDNPLYSFGVDVDEVNHIFVVHLRTPDKTDLFSSAFFTTAVREVCEAVMSTDIPRVSDECTFGDNGAEDLGREILKFCTDIGFAELEDRHCECKAHATADTKGVREAQPVA